MFSTEFVRYLIISPPDALYDWLTKGSTAGFQADLGLGPFRASGNAGFGASFSGPEEEAVLGGNFEKTAEPRQSTGNHFRFLVRTNHQR